MLAGITLRAGLGVPFLIAGAVTSVYHIGLYALFRDVVLADEKNRLVEGRCPD